jgi:hypothetical protein
VGRALCVRAPPLMLLSCFGALLFGLLVLIGVPCGFFPASLGAVAEGLLDP